ncbi:MAG TPA: DNA topoisomerase IB [Candidatus Tectomicrobia bacterium]|nr:DNA topoisomerase IB [Candidatus Tectomicrobia bacterium]
MGVKGGSDAEPKLNGAIAEELVAAAEEAGLQYVSDERPGYRRKPKRKEFEYFDTEGKPIRDEQRLLRIKRLAIPPAWTGVWICPSPNGHIQATGRDARGRKQYRYHERWREVRDENKFDRLAEFAKALPNIRRRVSQDLKLPGLSRQKVLATIVRLLERTFIRIGNEEYARENKSFGLTTLKSRHAKVRGAQVLFRFRGKSGRQHEVDVTDRRVAKVIAKCQDLPGQDLFQYLEEGEEVRDVTSQDVNDYLHQIAGNDFSAKDFRTWGGTVLAAIALSKQEEFQTKKEAKANIKTAICAVAELLGNTPAVCRKCYVHPVIVEAYLKRTRIAGLNGTKSLEPPNLRGAERAVLKFLRVRES